jgi:hypothetical protein
MDVRRGRGGLPRGPEMVGSSMGMVVKLREGVGSCACAGRGEQGGIGEGEGDDDGDEEEYIELFDDWWLRRGSSRADWVGDCE